MENLKMTENGLVPVYVTDKGIKVVYGLELHEILEVKSPYREWSVRRIAMLENFYKQYDIPTDFLPKYEHNGSRQMKSLSALLKENRIELSAAKFNQKLIECGYLEERERGSGKGCTKKFKALTEAGLQYGENAVNPHNQKEVQPLYYVDAFMELCGRVV